MLIEHNFEKCALQWQEQVLTLLIKWIFTDSNNIFLSEDIKKKTKLYSKISVDSSFSFPSYAWCVFHCSRRLLCWIKSRVRDFLWKLLSFHTKMISAQLLCGSVLLRRVHHKYAKNLHFKIFENTLYVTSVSMPLRTAVCCITRPL